MTQANSTPMHWGAEAVDPTARTLPGLKAEFLLRHIGKHGTVMEIGCGEGKLLRTLADRRRQLELHGCDIRVPRTRPDCYTFHLVTEEVPAEDHTFDAVLLFDVLEHVADPRRTLAEAARILRPGGRLIAFIPVEGERLSFYSLFRRLLGRDTYAITKDHIQAFRHQELCELIEVYFTVRIRRYAYHALGQLMDATFFAAARNDRLRQTWWEENRVYNRSAQPSVLGRVMNALLGLGNTIAFWESRLLAKVRFGSAGLLMVADIENPA